MTDLRIAPLEPPFPGPIRESLERIMPPGVPPLLLFRTLARNPRIFERIFASGMLDRGTLSLREREIVIHRTCARCGAEYEWGVHAAFFAGKVGLDDGQLYAIVEGDASAWPEGEGLLIRLVDELHDTSMLSDELWLSLSGRYGDEQLIELIALCGYYHMISFLVRGLSLPLEDYGRRFPGPVQATR